MEGVDMPYTEDDFIQMMRDSLMENAKNNHIAPKAERERIVEGLNKSNPSDVIIIDEDALSELCEMWCNDADDAQNKGVPSDILFSKNVALKDFDLTIKSNNKSDLKIRFCVFDDYINQVDSSGDDFLSLVGCVCQDKKGTKLIYPFYIKKGDNRIIPFLFCVDDRIDKIARRLEETMNEHFSESTTNKCLIFWYSIQLALLHPTIKEVFSHPKESLVFNKKSVNKDGKRRTTKNIRQHTIKAEDVKMAIDKKKEYNRKTLSWYVIGHWRKYKSGKKIFVQGYWKGALRELKRNIDDGRERVIDPTEVKL